MTNKYPNDRLLSLSCLEAVRILLKYNKNHPNNSMSKLLELIYKVEPDAENLDFDAAAYLFEYIERDCPISGVEFYQVCITSFIKEFQPEWLKAIPAGRKRFLKEISSRERDVFSAAGLLQETPNKDVLFWWLRVSEVARTNLKMGGLERSREAELLSLECERKKLKDIGILKQPEWMGLDDNYAGYDIKSYGIKGNETVTKLIEVKSTIASPPPFQNLKKRMG